MSRTRIMLLALAVTIAPDVAGEGARAEKRGQPPGPAPQAQPGEPPTVDGRGTPPDHSGTQSRGSTGWTGTTQEQNKTGPDVGSRALTGQQHEQAADQPETATGADLKGRPTRFTPADTPE